MQWLPKAPGQRVIVTYFYILAQMEDEQKCSCRRFNEGRFTNGRYGGIYIAWKYSEISINQERGRQNELRLREREFWATSVSPIFENKRFDCKCIITLANCTVSCSIYFFHNESSRNIFLQIKGQPFVIGLTVLINDSRSNI